MGLKWCTCVRLCQIRNEYMNKWLMPGNDVCPENRPVDQFRMNLKSQPIPARVIMGARCSVTHPQSNTSPCAVLLPTKACNQAGQSHSRNNLHTLASSKQQGTLKSTTKDTTHILILFVTSAAVQSAPGRITRTLASPLLIDRLKYRHGAHSFQSKNN